MGCFLGLQNKALQIELHRTTEPCYLIIQEAGPELFKVSREHPFSLDLFYFYACEWLACVCVCVCVPSACQWLAVCHHVGAGNRPQITWQEQQVLSTAELSFRSSFLGSLDSIEK